MSQRIALVIESLGGGGAQHVASTLANSWAKRGFDVTVVTLQGAEADAFPLDRAVRRIVVGGHLASSGFWQALGMNARRILRIRAAIKACRANLVISFIGSTNVMTVLATRGLSCRVVVAERNDPSRQSIGRIWDALRRISYRHADLVSANSRAAMDAMADFVPRSKLVWLANPLRTPPAAATTTAADTTCTERRPFLLAVGRLHPQKAYDVLLEAFAVVVRAWPQVRLVILGEGPLRGELERQAAELGIAEFVAFAGHVADPFPWYRAATALVHPARYEGLPNAVLEAMSEGLPVIVSDAQVGLREFVIDQESGLVVPVESKEALAAAMIRVVQDDGLRARIALQGRKAVEICRAENAIAGWTAAVGLDQSA